MLTPDSTFWRLDWTRLRQPKVLLHAPFAPEPLSVLPPALIWSSSIRVASSSLRFQSISLLVRCLFIHCCNATVCTTFFLTTVRLLRDSSRCWWCSSRRGSWIFALWGHWDCPQPHVSRQGRYQGMSLSHIAIPCWPFHVVFYHSFFVIAVRAV